MAAMQASFEAGQGGVPAQLYRRIKRDEWASVKSFTKDPRVDGDGDDAFLVRSYLGNVLYRVTRWKRDGEIYMKRQWCQP